MKGCTVSSRAAAKARARPPEPAMAIRIIFAEGRHQGEDGEGGKAILGMRA